MIEEWKTIDDDVEVSTFGNVRHHTTHEKINTYKCGNYVRLHRYGIHQYVHRLVAQVFIPNPDNLHEINHKDCNTANNNVDNLEWCIRKQNNAYKFTGPNAEHNRQVQKELNSRIKHHLTKHSAKTIERYKAIRNDLVWVHNEVESRFIHKIEVQSFLDNGYQLGRKKVKW